MDVDSLFCKIKEHCIADLEPQDEESFTKLYNYITEEEYDIQDLNDKDIQSMIQDHIKKQTKSVQTMNIFNKMTRILDETESKSNSIRISVSKPKEVKCLFMETFTELFPNSRKSLLAKDNLSIEIDKYITNNQFHILKRLEKVSMKNNIPIAEFLVTGYHQSGLSRDQYMAQNKLFKQLINRHNIAYSNKTINIAYESMREYLIEYEKHIAKPLPHKIEQPINVSKFNDDITIVINYIMEINNGIFTKNAKYPLQLDVFFIAPNSHNRLNLHSLTGLHYINGIISNVKSRQNAEAIVVLRNLLRRERNIHKSHGQRFILLIVRGNEDNSCFDTIYIYKPKHNNSIPPKHISDNVELTYLLNSKSSIVDGLSSSDVDVLGLTYHLHSSDCTKLYLSYGNHKSRVFKKTFLDKLQLLFNWNNNKRHYISASQRTQFMNSYPNLQDVKYAQYGKHWFENPVMVINKQKHIYDQKNATVIIKSHKKSKNSKQGNVVAPSYTYVPTTQQPFIQNHNMYWNVSPTILPQFVSSVPIPSLCPSMQRQQSMPCIPNVNIQYYTDIYQQMILTNNNLNAKQLVPQMNPKVNCQQILSECNTITTASDNNKKKKRRKKNKSHQRTFTNAYRKKYNNCATYDPPSNRGARRNIQISRKFTAKILTAIAEEISDIFSYIDKHTALHTNNVYMHGQIRIFNYNFHAKNGGHILYCVAKKQDAKNNRRYTWTMIDELFTKWDIARIYELSMNTFQQSMSILTVCINHKHINQINAMKQNIFDNKNNIKWNKIAIYSRNPKRRTDRSKLSITIDKFKNQIFDKYCMPLIPITMFKENNICIQYLWICSIRLDCYYGIDYSSLLMDKNSITYNYPKSIVQNILLHIVPCTDIAIGFEFNKQEKCIIPVGIHLDKFCIINNHQLLGLKHSMNDLNDFESVYDDLQIGNVDEDENYIKDLRKQNDIVQKDKKTLQEENERLKEIIKKLRGNK